MDGGSQSVHLSWLQGMADYLKVSADDEGERS